MADVAGIVLQVAVHRHNHRTGSVRYAGSHGRGLAVVAAKLYEHHTRIAAGDLIDHGYRGIRTPVIDEQDLKSQPEGRDGTDDGAVQGPHAVLLVEQRHDDRKLQIQAHVRSSGHACAGRSVVGTVVTLGGTVQYDT